METMLRLTAYSFVILFLSLSVGLEAATELQPHRAYYTITLSGQPPSHSNLSDVRGTMMLEFNKASGGWTVQQLSEVWRYQTDGSVEHVRWGYVTWEAEDGSHFKFNTFRKIDDELVENIRGSARRTGKLTQVIYQKPEPKTVDLPEGVLFPVQHMKGLLEAAESGEHMYPQIVFDGSSTEGASEINTFIGTKKVQAGNPSVEDTHQFANQPFWPIRFSVYGQSEAAYEPLYSTTQELLPNGIMKQYVIDNDGLKLRGTLERIELLRGN